jgi:hypothetical protein
LSQNGKIAYKVKTASYGKTIEEAIANLQEATELYL